MPIPVNNIQPHVMPTIPLVFSQVVQLVLSSRLPPQERQCVVTHDSCCLRQRVVDETSASIVLNILQKHTDILLERWIMSFDVEDKLDFSNDTLDFIQNVTEFIPGMPAKQASIEMYTIAISNNQQCHSFASHQDLIEFSPEAHLKAKRFHLPNLSLEVVFDEKASLYYKKPMICLQPVHPIVAVRRLSRLSLSAMELDNQKEEEKEIPSIPIPSPRMQYTHHTSFRTSIAYSSSPPGNFFDLQRRNSLTGEIHQKCLVGSFEESLLSGRMSSMPSKPITFHCQIGVLGLGDCKPSLKCPAHCSIVFPATFYKLGQEEEGNTPYVGTVDLQEPGYRIPPKGQLQVVVKNPNKTAVKLFLIPYDFQDMPKNTKTFLRQKSYTLDTRHLRYAIHLQFARTEKKRIYLYKSMRVVFANRIADAREKFQVVCEGPQSPVYRSM